MSRFTSALKTLVEIGGAMAEQQQKVNEMTNLLMQKTNGVNLDQAKKIAEVLVTQAEVTWK